MKIIIFKTDDGVAIISPDTITIIRLVALLVQQGPKLTPDNALDIAMKTIAEKDVPRILPPDKQELKDKGKMSLKTYLTFPIREYKIIDAGDLAPDFQNFKAARKYDLTLDVPKAREIRKDQIRIERLPQFETNDIFLRDSWIENNAVAIEAGVKERDRLRDLPDLVDAANTIEEIKAVTADRP